MPGLLEWVSGKWEMEKGKHVTLNGKCCEYDLRAQVPGNLRECVRFMTLPIYEIS